jgi:hypothetical protein
LGDLLWLLGDPLRILILVLVITGIYFLVKMLSPYVGKEINDAREFSGEPFRRRGKKVRDIFGEFYRYAIEAYRVKHYREALIALHKATVEYLLTRVIISSSGTKYTNNDLKRKLKGDPRFYQPFADITRYAEIAGFSSGEITQSDFESVLETFEKTFMD